VLPTLPALPALQHCLHFRPVSIELFPLLSFPLNPSLVREIRRVMQPCPSKVQKERSRDNTHLDHKQLIVKTNGLRDIKPQDFTDAGVFQALIYAP
jgi:hypothetical protein